MTLDLTHAQCRDPRRGTLAAVLEAGLKAVDAREAVIRGAGPRPAGRIFVGGAGKAAAAMAHGLSDVWGGGLTGRVITRRGHGYPVEGIEVIEAGHPVPDDAGRAAAQGLYERLTGLGPDDTLVFLLSGGASSLLSLPVPGVGLEALRTLTQELLASGAKIDEINAVRKALSRMAGGRLARDCRAGRILCLSISDVPGDDPATIGSGPFTGTARDSEPPLHTLIRRTITVAPELEAALAKPDMPYADDPCFSTVEYRLIARPMDALQAAAHAARSAGYEPILLGDALEGEAATVATQHAQDLIARAQAGARLAMLSGGELTVTGAGDSTGGRAREYALALAVALNAHPEIAAAAMDTDGIDGSDDAAGAVITPSTLERADPAGRYPAQDLAAHRSGAFFAALGDAIITGPTRTNIGDLRVALVH